MEADTGKTLARVMGGGRGAQRRCLAIVDESSPRFNAVWQVVALASLLGAQGCPSAPSVSPPAAPDGAAPAPPIARAPTPSSWFAPCRTDQACAGEADLCLRGGPEAEAGVCTARCDGGCGQGSCVRSPIVEGGAGWCLPHCSATSPCPSGWRCGLVEVSGASLAACLPPGAGAEPQGACQRELAEAGVIFSAAPSPSGSIPDSDLVCHIPDAVLLEPELEGVRFLWLGAEARPLLVDCELALALRRMARWLAERGVRSVDHVGTHNCRLMASGGRASQHAFGRAIDVRGLIDRRGRPVSVLHDWADREGARGKLLHDLARHLHDDFVFNVVLTPEYNKAHADHLHLDLTPDAHFLELDDEAFFIGD